MLENKDIKRCAMCNKPIEPDEEWDWVPYDGFRENHDTECYSCAVHSWEIAYEDDNDD